MDRAIDSLLEPLASEGNPTRTTGDRVGFDRPEVRSKDGILGYAVVDPRAIAPDALFADAKRFYDKPQCEHDGKHPDGNWNFSTLTLKCLN
ncbi:hypothetical protein KR51_00017940 [Rubidibacter lacunae KORDI 51-2]|uniref:Uncharacterized protein n=1 Tax=Rubidibacter lacunae KORDI 51-2 TaxID=582515 RepID=U5DPF1_9CHRO|nr:hypothetical protein KR51_00017940 [Rubidibacter lacunae KORDI 51-2]